jgi:hypothetical protein
VRFLLVTFGVVAPEAGGNFIAHELSPPSGFRLWFAMLQRWSELALGIHHELDPTIEALPLLVFTQLLQSGLYSELGHGVSLDWQLEIGDEKAHPIPVHRLFHNYFSRVSFARIADRNNREHP